MSKGVTVYALVKDGLVTDTIVWNGDSSNWSPPEGKTTVELRESDGPVSIDWLFDSSSFIAPYFTEQG